MVWAKGRGTILVYRQKVELGIPHEVTEASKSNAAMIAAAHFRFRAGALANASLNADPGLKLA